MPYCRLETNLSLSTSEQQAFLSRFSQNVATLLQKPESYVMLNLAFANQMLFAGTNAPCACISLKSIGLPEDKTIEFSAGLCGFISAELGIPSNRIYIEFINIPRALWGWDGRTF